MPCSYLRRSARCLRRRYQKGGRKGRAAPKRKAALPGPPAGISEAARRMWRAWAAVAHAEAEVLSGLEDHDADASSLGIEAPRRRRAAILMDLRAPGPRTTWAQSPRILKTGNRRQFYPQWGLALCSGSGTMVLALAWSAFCRFSF